MQQKTEVQHVFLVGATVRKGTKISCDVLSCDSTN